MSELQLTIYPPLTKPVDGSEIMAYREQFRQERKVRLSKRFTGAELAAELLWVIFHESECEVRGLRLILKGGDSRGIQFWADQNQEFIRKAAIIQRFCDLPNYDEEDQ